MNFLKFYVINTSDNLPFQPYYSNPHVISFQKICVKCGAIHAQKNVYHRIVMYFIIKLRRLHTIILTLHEVSASDKELPPWPFG